MRFRWLFFVDVKNERVFLEPQKEVVRLLWQASLCQEEVLRIVRVPEQVREERKEPEAVDWIWLILSGSCSIRIRTPSKGL